MKPALVLAAALAALLAPALVPALAPAPAAEGATGIAPGALVVTSKGQCTLNFVYTDAAGRLYVGTAGHCVDRVGDRVSTPGVGSFGTVVFMRGGGMDFALIAVDEGKRARVSPAVARWGGPTGVAEDAETGTGDLVALYGYGLVYRETEATRARLGVIARDDAREYAMDAPSINGDSGGPVLVKATGEALGIVSALGSGGGTTWGPRVSYILSRLHEAGWDVTLVTAPVATSP